MSELDRLVGWYELKAGKHVLLTYASDGALRLVGLDDEVFSHRFVPVSQSSFRWIRGRDEPETNVEFISGDDNGQVHFKWQDEAQGTCVATKSSTYGYSVRQLQYRNGEVSLSGSMFIPRSGGPFPAVVMIHGSGTSVRNNLWYMRIAHSLAMGNIAVLLPDKRGSGKSKGDWRTASFVDLAHDARAAVETVCRESEVDPCHVGLWGLSQGGWIAPLAANLTPQAAFVISISGPAVPPNQQLRYEERHRLARTGLPRFLCQAILPIAVWVVKQRLPEWWRMNGEFDSLPFWKSLTMPALMVYGSDDVLTPVEESVRKLAEVKQANPKSDFTIQVFEGSGHGLLEPGSNGIRKDFLNLQIAWVQRRVSEK